MAPRACGALAQRSHGPLQRIVRASILTYSMLYEMLRHPNTILEEQYQLRGSMNSYLSGMFRQITRCLFMTMRFEPPALKFDSDEPSPYQTKMMLSPLSDEFLEVIGLSAGAVVEPCRRDFDIWPV